MRGPGVTGGGAPPVEQRISVEQRTCGGRGGEEDKIIIVWPPLAIVEVVGSDELVEGSQQMAGRRIAKALKSHHASAIKSA